MSQRQRLDDPADGQPNGLPAYNATGTLALLGAGGAPAPAELLPESILSKRGTLEMMLDLPQEIFLLILEFVLEYTKNEDGTFNRHPKRWLEFSRVSKAFRRVLQHVNSDFMFLTSSGRTPKRSEGLDELAILAGTRFKKANASTLFAYISQGRQSKVFSALTIRYQKLQTTDQLNRPDRYERQTPLMHACKLGLTNVTGKLLEAAGYIDMGIKEAKRIEAKEKGLRVIVPKNQSFLWRMLKSKDAKGRTALLLFASHFPYDNMDIPEMIIESARDAKLKDYVINEPDIFGNTPLHYAFKSRKESLAKYLISIGANLDARNDMDQTMLMLACKRGWNDVVLDLLSKGANINDENMFGRTALFFASGITAATLLERVPVERRPDFINKKDEFGQASFYLALRADEPNTISTLLDNGADISFPEDDKSTLLMNAVKYMSNKVILELIVRGYDINEEFPDGTPLSCAIEFKRDFTIKNYLIPNGCDINKKFNSAGDTPLIYALHLHRWDIAKILLDKHADVSISNDSGKTPLHEIVDIDYQYDNVENRDDMLKKLGMGRNIQHAIDAQDDRGFTALHILANAEHPNANKYVKILIEVHAADIDLQDRDGDTPLHMLFSTGLNNEDYILDRLNLFLKNMPDLTIRNFDGLLALDIAKENEFDDHILWLMFSLENIQFKSINKMPTLHYLFASKHNPTLDDVKLFLLYRPNLTERNADGETPSEIATDEHLSGPIIQLLRLFENINLQDERGNTPFHRMLASEPNPTSYDLILFFRHKPNLTIKNNDGKTPIDIAIERNLNRSVISGLRKFEKFNVKDADGNTEFHKVFEEVPTSEITFGRIKRSLFMFYPDLTIRNNDGMTVRDLARERNFDERIVELLDEDVVPMET